MNFVIKMNHLFREQPNNFFLQVKEAIGNVLGVSSGSDVDERLAVVGSGTAGDLQLGSLSPPDGGQVFLFRISLMKSEVVADCFQLGVDRVPDEGKEPDLHRVFFVQNPFINHRLVENETLLE